MGERERVYSLWEHNNTDEEIEKREMEQMRRRRRTRRRGSKCLSWKASTHVKYCIFFFPETDSRRMAAATATNK